MKELLRKLVTATGFKKSKLYFYIQYMLQVKSLKPDLQHPQHRDVLEELEREGIAIVPGFFAKEDCDRILSELDGIYDAIKAGTFGGKYQYNHEKLIRTIETDTVAETTKQFFQHPVLDEIAKAYIDPRAYSYRRESELKFFLYLTDVEKENAPFTYLTRTHKQFKGRRKKDLEYERDGETGAYGHFHPQEVRELRRHLECEEKVCIAKAGTLIIADFRGLHKGTPLKAGRRVLLNATYGI
jgi:hypothetical protein